MSLLDLPTEVLGLIVQHCYEPWNLRLRNKKITDGEWKFEMSGHPIPSLMLTCRILHELATEAEIHSFSGTMIVTESKPSRVTDDAYMKLFQGNPRHRWIQDHLRTISFVPPSGEPALWRALSLWDLYPNLKRIRLDSRHQFHFRVHPVDSISDFLSGNDIGGELFHHMNYLNTHLMDCDDFILTALRRGIAVNVIYATGVQEHKDTSQVLIVSVDHIMDESGGVRLNPDTVEIRATTVKGRPFEVRPILESMDFK